MKKVVSTMMAGILLLAFATSGLTAEGKEAPKTIKFGSAYSLTGPLAGANGSRGYEIAAEHINKNGGVFVKEFNKKIPMEVIVLDDESNPTLTVSRMESLYATHGVVAYLGGVTSFIQAAQAPVAEKNKVPFVMEGTMFWAIHQKGYKYNFSPFPKSNDAAAAIVQMLDSIPVGQRPKKVAMFMEKGPVGMELADMFKKEMKKHGGYDLVIHKEHTMGMKDFSSLILPAKAAGADMLIAGPAPADGLLMVKQMKELEYFPKFFFMYRAADSWSWSQGMGKDGDYLCATPGWSNRVTFPAVAELNKRHREKYNRDADVHVGPCYACAQILVNAIERAGTLDRAKIRDAVASTNMMTVIGPVKFRPDGTGDVIPFVLQWQNTKSEIVWPREQATAPLLFPAPKWSERH